MKYVSFAVCVSLAICGCDNRHEHGHKHGPNCSHSHEHPAKAHAAEKHEHHEHCDKKRVKVAEATQRVMGLKVANPEMRRVSSSLELYGRFEMEPTARQTVATPVAGRIDVLVKPLATVKKGDVIFTVSSPDLVARAREIDILEKRLRVYTEMKTRNAALENELAVKRAEREALIGGAQEKDGVVSVRAAGDGIVESLAAKTGDWLEIGAAALVTVNMKALRFKALVEPAVASRLVGVSKAKVGSVTGELRLGIATQSALVPVYVVFESGIEAVAGMRCAARVETAGDGDERLAVPSKSIVRVGVQSFVFVKDPHDGESFIVVAVTPGESAGGWTAIEESLGCDTLVVTDGAYELKLAIPGETKKKSGHFHADGVFHEGEH